MTVDQAVDVVQESLKMMLVLSSPILLAGMVIGLLVSVVQAATQIQEQTLSFVPKILGMGVVAILVAPWVTKLVLQFSARMLSGG